MTWVSLCPLPRPTWSPVPRTSSSFELPSGHLLWSLVPAPPLQRSCIACCALWEPGGRVLWIDWTCLLPRSELHQPPGGPCPDSDIGTLWRSRHKVMALGIAVCLNSPSRECSASGVGVYQGQCVLVCTSTTWGPPYGKSAAPSAPPSWGTDASV